MSWHFGEPPVLAESSLTTFHGLKQSVMALTEALCRALVEYWERRRGDRSHLDQQALQWKEGRSPRRSIFRGYAPGSAPYSPTAISANPHNIRGLRAAQVFDDQRPTDKNPPPVDED
jgi:hypothetical protein